MAATFEDLLGKKPHRKTIYLVVDGHPRALTFQAVEPLHWRRLIESHPPTDEQIDRAEMLGRNHPQLDADTFDDAIVAASLIEPKLTEEQLAEIWATGAWSTEERATMVAAAMEVNLTSSLRDQESLGKGSSGTTSSEQS